MEIAVAVTGDQAWVQPLDGPATKLSRAELPALIAAQEASEPRWIWADTAAIAPELISAGVGVRRCHDLRLCRAILRSALPDGPWQESSWDEPHVPAGNDGDSLVAQFTTTGEVDIEQVHSEYRRQRSALEQVGHPARMRLLLAAESAGALVAAEMHQDGLPWDRQVHDDILTGTLGPRPHHGARPATLENLAAQIRSRLHASRLNPDSPAELLRALRAEGLDVRTTRKGELTGIDHPVIEPLLQYKSLSRLLSANGWAWMDTWVRPGSQHRRGRFHPDYTPGGVPTGRWATSGGGALQLPKQLRSAVRADPGWMLVVADAAQIEPRVLAAMSADPALAAAGRGADLYQGLVADGVDESRDRAKVAMLGALYGATSGAAGQLMPRLRRSYPRAITVVDQAAAAGEQGRRVHTWLGRTSPLPPQHWQDAQARAGQVQATAQTERAAQQLARDWGRFTRNFVVQGTAAEWALCWLAETRRRLRELSDDAGRAHLVYFLHDEVLVHTPQALAHDVARIVTEAAQAAGQLLFGATAVEFILDVAVVSDHSQAG